MSKCYNCSKELVPQHDRAAISSLDEFLAKYGREGWKLPIEEFITHAPEFNGDAALASTIGTIVADLEFALRDYQGRNLPPDRGG